MTLEDILKLDTDLTTNGQSLMRKKNADYAGGDADPLRNFRQFGPIGVLVRLSDKLARLRTYIEKGSFAVTDETFRDTILDSRNYLCILLAMIDEQSEPILPAGAHLQTYVCSCGCERKF